MSKRIVVSVPDNKIVDALNVIAAGECSSNVPGDSSDWADSAGVEFVQWDFASTPPAEPVDIVVPPYLRGVGVLSQLERLHPAPALIQWQSIGFDGVAEVLPTGQVFANAATVHETATAEMALTLALTAQRAVPHFVDAQRKGRWEPVTTVGLADQRVLLLGYGGVGKAIAKRLAAFEVELTVVASHERDEADGQHVYAMDALPDLLPNADVVIVVVPLTATTQGLVDAGFLAQLHDDALVVNIARGPVANTDAILAEADRLRFALDVTDPEPLPDGHPLFAQPSVLISPHVGGASNAMWPRMARLLARQVKHLQLGEPFENVVLRS